MAFKSCMSFGFTAKNYVNSSLKRLIIISYGITELLSRGASVEILWPGVNGNRGQRGRETDPNGK